MASTEEGDEVKSYNVGIAVPSTSLYVLAAALAKRRVHAASRAAKGKGGLIAVVCRYLQIGVLSMAAVATAPKAEKDKAS